VILSALAAAWALSASAAELGGHDQPAPAAASPADERRATLEEMWQRRLLAPDQSVWAPADLELLQKMRRAERDALKYFRHRPGGERPWTAKPRGGGLAAEPKLTKEGYDRYIVLVTQDAIDFFENKGADAKWVFKLRDWEDHPLFDPTGKVTEEGISVYTRARLKLEVYWKSPDGEAFGTRRPPTNNP
jgi:hypothetical protein